MKNRLGLNKMALMRVVGMAAAAVLFGASWGHADCQEAYGEKIFEVGAKAQGVKTSMWTFAGATGVTTLVGGPPAWAGNGSLAISSAVYFKVLKRAKKSYRLALATIEEAPAGSGPHLQELATWLQKSKVDVSQARLGEVISAANSQGVFCVADDEGVHVMKAGALRKWVRNQLQGQPAAVR